MSHCREEAGDGGEHSSHHHHDHGHDHDHDHDGDGDGQSLYGMIDTTRVTCLNESEPGGILRCIKPWDRRMELDPYLESQEDDPELLIHVPFSQVVKVRAISIRGGMGGTSPSKFLVWVNRDDVDFSNANELPPIQTIEVVNPQLEGGNVIQDYPVKVAKCFTLACKGCNNLNMRATTLFCSFLREKG
eukprot:449808_1